jgi:hypothetical protein
MLGSSLLRDHPGAVRALAPVLAGAALIAMVGLSAPVASADTAPASGTPATDSADPLPTWQINADGVVWDTVTVGNIVYATGNFKTARPPGTAEGDAKQVNRANLLAFDIRTGVVTSFAHTLNGQGLRLAVSSDSKILYVGGDFTTVDGAAHQRLAAFTIATGKLITGFKPTINGSVRAIAATATEVYIGGSFTVVDGVSHQRLAAVHAGTGAVYTWNPRADESVYALAIAPGGTRVIVGGRFQTINEKAHVGIASVAASNGAQQTWTSKPIPTRKSDELYSYVTDLVISGTTVYGSADGEGTHWFDGRFAALASNGNLVWLDNCYGATYSGFVTGSVFYSVGHAHDCASLNGFPETSPRTNHRALAETTNATGHDVTDPGENSNYSGQPIPTLLHWYPTLVAGDFTGQNQAAWAVTGTSQYLALAGEFPSVNGIAQQGLVRFAVSSIAPNKTGPVASAGLVPTVTSPTAGGVHVSWIRTWDQDNRSLTYNVYRDNGATAVRTFSANSEFWTLTELHFDDKGLTPGSTHTYKITATDPFGNIRYSAGSQPVTVSGP